MERQFYVTYDISHIHSMHLVITFIYKIPPFTNKTGYSVAFVRNFAYT